jgi:signal transduction protein with GAF and PtsI domain
MALAKPTPKLHSGIILMKRTIADYLASARRGIWHNKGTVSRVKDLESRLENTELQLRLLQKISRFMVREKNLGASVQEVVSLVVEFMACDSCLLYLLQGPELVLCASNNPRPETIGRVRLHSGEGLTGWVARERRLLAISREAYGDPRFKFFTSLPEDTYEAFLSAPVVVRDRVAGVINVQHREPHFHSGGEMELLTTVGEQIGCLVALAQTDLRPLDTAQVLDLVMAPARRG